MLFIKHFGHQCGLQYSQKAKMRLSILLWRSKTMGLKLHYHIFKDLTTQNLSVSLTKPFSCQEQLLQADKVIWLQRLAAISTFIIIIKQVLQKKQKMMQNYHFSPNFAINYALIAPTQQLYQPIIFIDPSFPFFLPTISPQFQQFTSKLQLPTLSEQNTSQSHLNHEKTQEKDEVPRKAQTEGDSKVSQDSIEFLTVANRNILPNNLNLILSYIRRVNKSGREVRRAIEKLNGDKGNKSVKKFYSYQAYLKQHIPFHKTKHTIKELTQYTDSNYSIFTYEEQMFYNKVCRIVIYNFIRGEYYANLLTSSKIQKTNKKDHLKVRRYLQLKLEGANQYHLEPYKLIEN